MIEVLFFARLREQLGVARMSLVAVPGQTLNELRARLVAEHGAHWQAILYADNVIKAVNQEVVARDCVLADGDEVAFFPPVTGG